MISQWRTSSVWMYYKLTKVCISICLINYNYFFIIWIIYSIYKDCTKSSISICGKCCNIFKSYACSTYGSTNNFTFSRIIFIWICNNKFIIFCVICYTRIIYIITSPFCFSSICYWISCSPCNCRYSCLTISWSIIIYNKYLISIWLISWS